MKQILQKFSLSKYWDSFCSVMLSKLCLELTVAVSGFWRKVAKLLVKRSDSARKLLK